MAEPFVLPSSKLTPPRTRVALLPRSHLLDLFRRGLARRLVLLTAEAGYGKTTLLASALGGVDRPVAWLTLDERDTDPTLFAAGIVLALQRVAPGAGKRALEILAGGPSARTVEAVLTGCLEAIPEGTVIVLDDFHVLDDTPAAQALADYLVAHLPPHAHAVVASRTRPTLRSLPRLLVQEDAHGPRSRPPRLHARRGDRSAAHDPWRRPRRAATSGRGRAHRGLARGPDAPGPGGREPRPARAGGDAAGGVRVPRHRRARGAAGSASGVRVPHLGAVRDHSRAVPERVGIPGRARVPRRARAAEPLRLSPGRSGHAVPLSPALRRVPAPASGHRARPTWGPSCTGAPAGTSRTRARAIKR